jgi:hypothetical protein
MADMNKEQLFTLRNEIDLIEKFNETELQPILHENLLRYIGAYVPNIGTTWDIMLNEVYPVIQNNLPSIFFRNPRVFFKPRNKTYIAKRRNPISGQMEDVQLDSAQSAKTQEQILNYLLTQIGYKRQTRKVLMDALLFPYGIMWHGYKGDFGMTEEKSITIENDRIFVQRINPMRFIYDPSVTIATIDEAKWIGRVIDIPIQDLLEDDKLDVDKNLIKGKVGFADKLTEKVPQIIQKGGQDIQVISGRIRNLIDFADESFRRSRAARFVKLYEVYVRPSKKDKRDGKKGKIILMTDEQPKPLRINDWMIKAEGWPALVLQFNELNDNKFGLSDVETYKSISDHKNIITNLQIRNAQENTKVWVGISKEGTDEEQIQHVQKGENTIVLFDTGNPRDRMFVATPGGGASSELYLIDQRIQKNLEDKSGVTDLKRGFLQSGEESAASVKLRSLGGQARPSYRQDLMADFLKRSFLYLNQLNKQFMTVKDAVRVIGSLDVQWSNNPSKQELQADVDVEIDTISMLPENPEKELREYNTILALMVQAITTPPVMQKISQEGKTMNLGPIIEQILFRMKVRDPEIFRNTKPEESQGFVSVQQLREAKANVEAAISGQQIPHPPQMDDDHLAKIESYTSAAQLLEAMGQVSDALQQLIQIHSVLLQEIQKKEATPGQAIRLSKPKLETVGT